MPAARRTVAVYGGSFNPPHNAHVMVAQHLSREPSIDAVWIVPTFQHAFDKSLVDFTHRVRMCELAFASIDKAQVLEIESELGGRSLMVRTLEALTQRHPDVQLRLVIGSDLVDELNRWTEPERIRSLAPLWIVQREGSTTPTAQGPVFPAVSSTEIREHVRLGDDVSAWVPAAVVDYIARHGLYRAPAAPSL